MWSIWILSPRAHSYHHLLTSIPVFRCSHTHCITHQKRPTYHHLNSHYTFLWCSENLSFLSFYLLHFLKLVGDNFSGKGVHTWGLAFIIDCEAREIMYLVVSVCSVTSRCINIRRHRSFIWWPTDCPSSDKSRWWMIPLYYRVLWKHAVMYLKPLHDVRFCFILFMHDGISEQSFDL